MWCCLLCNGGSFSVECCCYSKQCLPVCILMLNTFAYLNSADLKSINDTPVLSSRFGLLSVQHSVSETAVNCHFYLFALIDIKEILNNFITERIMCVLFVCLLALKRRNGENWLSTLSLRINRQKQ